LRDFLEWTFPLYLTSLKVQGEASPLPVADDDLELLGYLSCVFSEKIIWDKWQCGLKANSLAIKME